MPSTGLLALWGLDSRVPRWDLECSCMVGLPYVLPQRSLGVHQEVGPNRSLGLRPGACGFPEELF